jgi:iron complex transport system substrate-binding protein
VYTLPLPETFWGICDSAVRLGALAGDPASGRRLAEKMSDEAAHIKAGWEDRSPLVYIEAWFGRHPRTIGGRSFIHDTVRIAGGSPLLSKNPGGYLPLDAIGERKAELTEADFLLGFHEPEFYVDFAEVAARHWPNEARRPRVVVSDTERGRNIIHDGPSLLETAKWLQQEFKKSRNS